MILHQPACKVVMLESIIGYVCTVHSVSSALFCILNRAAALLHRSESGGTYEGLYFYK